MPLDPEQLVIDTPDSETRSLPWPKSFIGECERNPGSVWTIGLLTVNQLSLRLVENPVWNWINATQPETALINSRETVNEKVELYTSWFDDALIAAMEHTDFINLELDIWSNRNGRSYLGIAASFVPNLLNEKLLKEQGQQALLNSFQMPSNSHLLECVEITDSSHKDKHLLKNVAKVLKKYKITDKVSSITSGNAARNTSANSYPLHDLLKPVKPKAFLKTNDFHHIHCASHTINTLFQDIVTELQNDETFNSGLEHIRSLAATIEHTPTLRSSLADAGLSLIPLETEKHSFLVWNQIAVFVENYDKYVLWCRTLQASAAHQRFHKNLKTLIDLPDATKHLLAYFVSCCSIFQHLEDTLQNDSLSNLPNAVTFYYTIKGYFELCKVAEVETIETAAEGYFDYTFINGAQGVPENTKAIVLKAVLSGKPKFEEYFEDFSRNDIYFVGAFLDPSLKFDCFNELIGGKEGEYHALRVETYIKHYLAQCRFKSSKPGPCINTATTRMKNFQVNKLLRPNRRQKQSTRTYVLEGIKAFEEWESYKAESQLSSDSTTDAVRWWYSRRAIYPNLFPLALSMLYTKFSTCGIERTFSTCEKLVRKKKSHSGSAHIKHLMVLRDRFTAFGVFNKKQAMACLNRADKSFVELSKSDEFSLEEDDTTAVLQFEHY
ncbi:putative transposase of the Rover hAT-like DNA transposon [Lachancea lanzarotensis]|uniref:LALA0S03e10308g1_1 n=1 Tax=Lachancea lanzarotensis TaxID=1245769 RepID=A0A0C7N561_9SACH|nr:putative transposase of the Rover hAT-like DNA transposon [Lachancea lanzarotensis]CEP61758.1 putative transposase of the Rover hAT-like DNA transposon [Lachancea lanzarotensis]